MDENSYRAWWEFHRRAANGEPLTAEERAVYEAGLKQLHEDELSVVDLTEIRQLRKMIADLEASNARLRAECAALEARVAAAEASLSERTRQLLHAED
jgi:hypothetical protein